MADDKPIQVVVAFKQIAGAFKLAGDGDGGELIFVFDRSEVFNATAAWAAFSGDRLIRLTLEPAGRS